MDLLDDDVPGGVEETVEEAPEAKSRKPKKEKPPKAKKEKKEKPPKEKKTKEPRQKKEKPKKEKAEKAKKPLSAGKAALITALVLLLLIGGASAAVITDVGGVRATVVSALQGGADVAKSEKELELMAKEKELKKQEEDIAVQKKAADSRESALEKKESELGAREALVTKAEQDAANNAASLEQLAEVYSRMEPASAAQILSQIKNIEDVTDILRQMKQNKVADILAAMTPELASKITVQIKTSAGAAPAGSPAPTPATTG